MGAQQQVDDFSQYQGPLTAALIGGAGAATAMLTDKVDRRKQLPFSYKLGRFITGCALGAIVYLICQEQHMSTGLTSLCVFLVGTFNTSLVDFIWLQLRRTVSKKLGNDKA